MLDKREPPAFEKINAKGSAPCLLVCDHASPRFPAALGDMGIDPEHHHEHIAWDIGAAAITRHLSSLLDAPALLAGYSRLVVDCNRYGHDAAAIAQISDGIAIPANLAISDRERRERIATFYRPYHDAINAELEGYAAQDIEPSFIAVHTMTDRLRGGARRDQQFTLCWARDARFAEPVLTRMRAGDDIVVGDNEPYRLDLGEDYTVPEHAMRRGLTHLQIEVRQDLVAITADAQSWAERIHNAIHDLVADDAFRAARHFWP